MPFRITRYGQLPGRPGFSPSQAKPPKVRGAGDVLAKVLKPIARTIDRMAGTDLEHCQECAARQKMLNEMFSFNRASK